MNQVSTDAPAPAQKFYRGKPENQRDRSATHQPFPKKGPKAPKAKPPATLPPPTQKAANVGGTISTTNPAESSLFAESLDVSEEQARTTFTPSMPSFVSICRQTYSEIVTDDPSLEKKLLPEYLTYYGVSMLWFRMITLKQKNSQPLTPVENALLDQIATASFSIPEPLLLQLRAIGNVVTRTGQHLYPEFPSLPARVIANQGGYYGTLSLPAPDTDDTRHTLYEEIPCLGVAAYAVRQSVSNAQPGIYQSAVTLNGQQPNSNLLGFGPLGYRRPEAKNIAFDQGINENDFPSYPRNTAVNFGFLMAISNALANTRTFKVSNVVFTTLTEIGAISQTIIQHPLLSPDEDDTTSAINGEVKPTSLTREPAAIFGSGLFFLPQLMKESRNDNHRSWSMFAVTPPEWIANRNIRRNLPAPYGHRVFSSVSKRCDAFRINIIKTLVLTKR